MPAMANLSNCGTLNLMPTSMLLIFVFIDIWARPEFQGLKLGIQKEIQWAEKVCDVTWNLSSNVDA